MRLRKNDSEESLFVLIITNSYYDNVTVVGVVPPLQIICVTCVLAKALTPILPGLNLIY